MQGQRRFGNAELISKRMSLEWTTHKWGQNRRHKRSSSFIHTLLLHLHTVALSWLPAAKMRSRNAGEYVLACVCAHTTCQRSRLGWENEKDCVFNTGDECNLATSRRRVDLGLERMLLEGGLVCHRAARVRWQELVGGGGYGCWERECFVFECEPSFVRLSFSQPRGHLP